VDHLKATPTQLAYTERFHYITKTSNYEEMSDQAIWREYEKLRDCLRTLNEEILMEMEKKAVLIRKNEPPKSKTQQEMMKLMDEEKLMN
jgi:hypothetical protein